MDRIVIVPVIDQLLLIGCHAVGHNIQRGDAVRHHVSTYGELVIFHQGLEAFRPICAQSSLEWLERFGHILVWCGHKSTDASEMMSLCVP